MRSRPVNSTRRVMPSVQRCRGVSGIDGQKRNCEMEAGRVRRPELAVALAYVLAVRREMLDVSPHHEKVSGSLVEGFMTDRVGIRRRHAAGLDGRIGELVLNGRQLREQGLPVVRSHFRGVVQRTKLRGAHFKNTAGELIRRFNIIFCPVGQVLIVQAEPRAKTGFRPRPCR